MATCAVTGMTCAYAVPGELSKAVTDVTADPG